MQGVPSILESAVRGHSACSPVQYNSQEITNIKRKQNNQGNPHVA